MSPSSTATVATRYRCRYHSCKTTCARRADMKRHEVQRHQSSKVFCPQPECKFRGTTRPAVIRRHFEHRHPRVCFKEIERFLVDKFAGEDRKVAVDDLPAPLEAEHLRRSSQDFSNSDSFSSPASYDSSGYTVTHYPQMTSSPSSAKISAGLASIHPFEIASSSSLSSSSSSHQKFLGVEPLPYNVMQHPFTNYILDSTVCFDQSFVQFSDPTAQDFITFVEGLWRGTPAFQQHSLLEYTKRFN